VITGTSPGVLPVCIECGQSAAPKQCRPAFRVWQQRPIVFFRCRRCGLVFKDPGVYRAEDEFSFDSTSSSRQPDALTRFRETFHTDGQIVDEHGRLYPTFGYDQDELVSGIFDGVEKKLRQHAALTPESQFRLLEVGCATGFLLARFRQKYPRAELIGVDPSPFSVGKARQIEGVTVHCGTLDRVPLEPASFDAVVMIGNFQLHRDPPATLQRVFRLLKPNGLLIFDTKNPVSWFRGAGRVLSRTWPLNRLGVVRRLVNSSHTGMRYGIPKALLSTWLARAGFEILQLSTKNLRVFEFSNTRPVSHGVRRWVWNVLNIVDVLRDQRAWLDVCCRKPCGAKAGCYAASSQTPVHRDKPGGDD